MSEELREKIARIIDPGAWNAHDQKMQWADRPKFAESAEKLRRQAIFGVQESLTQADDILALFAHPAPSQSMDAVREALEPMASLADAFIDHEGWKSPPMRERIVDWFGPSDFRRARSVLAALQAAGEGE